MEDARGSSSPERELAGDRPEATAEDPVARPEPPRAPRGGRLRLGSATDERLHDRRDAGGGKVIIAPGEPELAPKDYSGQLGGEMLPPAAPPSFQ